MFVFSGGVKVTISHMVWKKHFPYFFQLFENKLFAKTTPRKKWVLNKLYFEKIKKWGWLFSPLLIFQTYYHNF